MRKKRETWKAEGSDQLSPAGALRPGSWAASGIGDQMWSLLLSQEFLRQMRFHLPAGCPSQQWEESQAFPSIA